MKHPTCCYVPRMQAVFTYVLLAFLVVCSQGEVAGDPDVVSAEDAIFEEPTAWDTPIPDAGFTARQFAPCVRSQKLQVHSLKTSAPSPQGVFSVRVKVGPGDMPIADGGALGLTLALVVDVQHLLGNLVSQATHHLCKQPDGNDGLLQCPVAVGADGSFDVEIDETKITDVTSAAVNIKLRFTSAEKGAFGCVMFEYTAARFDRANKANSATGRQLNDAQARGLGVLAVLCAAAWMWSARESGRQERERVEAAQRANDRELQRIAVRQAQAEGKGGKGGGPGVAVGGRTVSVKQEQALRKKQAFEQSMRRAKSVPIAALATQSDAGAVLKRRREGAKAKAEAECAAEAERTAAKAEVRGKLSKLKAMPGA